MVTADKGTIQFWLSAPTPRWTDGKDIDFGIQAHEGILVETWKRGERLRFITEGPFGQKFTFEGDMPEPKPIPRKVGSPDELGVRIVLAWEKRRVRLWANGALVGDSPA